MRITFVQGHKPRQHDGNGPDYKAGETHDFPGPVAETYARKYIRLGYAIEAPAEAVMLPAVVAPEAVTPSPLPPAAPEAIPNATLPAPTPEPIPNAPVRDNVTTWPKQRGRNRSSR